MYKTLSLIGLMTFALTSTGTVLADDATTNAAQHDTMKKMKEPTPEMRQKMADAHQKMADCLKSTKPISDCKEEMMKNCPMMKNGHCMMMEGGGHGDSSDAHSAHHPDSE